MARINIEECWWTDPRREKLGKLVGGTEIADGLAIRMWRVAQEFWKAENKLIPLQIFKTLESSAFLIESGLAELRGESVYVRGSSQYFEWLKEKRESGSLGGKRSAEARRKKYGSAQPKKGKSSNDPRTTPERSSNESNEIDTKQVETSKHPRSTPEGTFEKPRSKIEPSYSSSFSNNYNNGGLSSTRRQEIMFKHAKDIEKVKGLLKKALNMTPAPNIVQHLPEILYNANFDLECIKDNLNSIINSDKADFEKNPKARSYIEVSFLRKFQILEELQNAD